MCVYHAVSCCTLWHNTLFCSGAEGFLLVHVAAAGSPQLSQDVMPPRLEAAQKAAEECLRNRSAAAPLAQTSFTEEQLLSLPESTLTGQAGADEVQREELRAAQQATKSLGRLLLQLPASSQGVGKDSMAQVRCFTSHFLTHSLQ